MLLASSSTLEGITQLCREYFCNSSIELHQEARAAGLISYSVYNAKGLIKGCHVILKGKRYRFEKED